MPTYESTRMVFAIFAIGLIVGQIQAQPGHDPFVFGELEIDNFERSLVPEGVDGATIVFDGAVPGFHPAAVAAGEPSVPYLTGAPLFLENASSAWAQYGGILGTTDGGAVTTSNFNNIFPGGWAIGNETNGGQSRNQPNTPNSYNGARMSLVTRTDDNTEDDVAITNGEQALRIEMLNVSQGDGDTSFDRPVSMVIKPTDFWGVADSRFNTFEMVRENPQNFSIAIDVTYLASEIPDEFARPDDNPYIRSGFYNSHAGSFSESPNNVVQHPPALAASGGDADGDGLVDFSDTDFIDPNNTPGLPGEGVPGVFQRRYVFPASNMNLPATSLAGAAENGNRQQNGGYANAYVLGLVFNGDWALGTYASIFLDNLRFIDGVPVASVDFNGDEALTAADWEILVANLNSTAEGLGFTDGDIGSAPSGLEPGISPGAVDFQDFRRFEVIWDAHNGGAGAFQAFLASHGIPEPSTLILLALGLSMLLFRRDRASWRIPALLIGITVFSSSNPASAQLSNTLLFGFEVDEGDGGDPEDPKPLGQGLWDPAGDAANADMPPILGIGATGATEGSSQALSIQQNGDQFSWDAFVGIFGGDAGLPNQQQAWNDALDIGANHFQLEYDVTYRDANVPPASFVSAAVRLTAGGSSTDTVFGLAGAGTGAGPIPDDTIHVAVPLSIDPVDTEDEVLSVPASAAQAGFYNLTLGFDGDWGVDPATFYVDNIRLVQVSQPTLLTLEVNRATGEAFIKNTPGANSGPGAVVFDYYEIRSEAGAAAADYNGDGAVNAADYTAWRDTLDDMVDPGTGADGDGDGTIGPGDYDVWAAAFGETGSDPVLNAAGWNSLDAQNIDATGGGDQSLEGWDASGSPSSSVLTEAFLIGSSTWDEEESLSIGTIFTPGGEENLTFVYREPSRPDFLRTGLVTYVGGAGGTAIPEPSSLLLAMAVALSGIVHRGCGSSRSGSHWTHCGVDC